MNGVDEVIRLTGIGKHRRLQDLLSSYVDSQVSPSESRRVENHLSACEECRRELGTLQATAHLLRELPDLEPSRSFALESVAAPTQAVRGYLWAPRLATYLVAALVVVLLLGDFSGIFIQSDKAVTEITEIESVAATEATPVPPQITEMAAAAPEPEKRTADQIVVEVEKEVEVAAPAPTAAPVTVAAAAVEPTEQPKKEVAVEIEKTVEVQQAERVEALSRQEPLPSPEPAVPPGTTPTVPKDTEGVRLPLWQLELATGVVLVVLILATVWWTRRGRRWSP